MSSFASFVKPKGAPQPLDAIPALWRGNVREVMADGMVWVYIPRLSGEEAMGPMPTSVVGLLPNEPVLVAAMEDSRNDLLVVSRLSDGQVVLPGRFSFVELDLPPTAPNHATRKDYVDAQVATRAPLAHKHAAADITSGNLAWARMPLATILATTGTNLNDCVTNGAWHQNANAGASGGLNYPAPLAGMLEVFTNGGGFIYQRYTTYNATNQYANKVFYRGLYVNVWSSWVQVAANDSPTFTGTVTAPIMRLTNTTDASETSTGHAFQIGPDNATNLIIDNNEILGRNNGALSPIYMAGGIGSLPEPGGPSFATNKTYVDGQVGTRAPTVHRHSYGDIDGVVPTSALPPLAITDTFVVGSQAAMLALTAERGDMCIRTDTSLTFVLAADNPGLLVNWKQILAAGQVLSVNGKTGVVSLTKTDIGLGLVDNTSDAFKPVSAATKTALDGKASSIHNHSISDVISLQSALDGKASTSLANQAQPGLMSAADKTILDKATSDVAGNTLARRDNNGRIKTYAPSTADDAANKGYVDGLKTEVFEADSFSGGEMTAQKNVAVISVPAKDYDRVAVLTGLAFANTMTGISEFSVSGLNAIGRSISIRLNSTVAQSYPISGKFTLPAGQACDLVLRAHPASGGKMYASGSSAYMSFIATVTPL